MNVKSEINQLQKQLLVRLNVRKGTTLFTIIEAISRQAYATSSFVVSQKNSTLAEKCNVTASTISRNLKKLKEKCPDLITIEQNRNTEEKFAALVFTFIPMSNGMSNGQQTELVNVNNDYVEVAENTSSLTTESHVLNNKTNIDLIHNLLTNDVNNQKIINEVYLEHAQKGINKKLFFRVLKEIENTPKILNFKAYLRGALNKVVYHKEFRAGNIEFDHTGDLPLYNWLIE